MPRLDAGTGCATDDKAHREWSELLVRRVGVELNNAYRDEVAREPIAPALEVRAFVNDVEMQVCQARAGAWQGGFRVQVTWTIQEPGTDRVLYQGSTAVLAPTAN